MQVLAVITTHDADDVRRYPGGDAITRDGFHACPVEGGRYIAVHYICSATLRPRADEVAGVIPRARVVSVRGPLDGWPSRQDVADALACQDILRRLESEEPTVEVTDDLMLLQLAELDHLLTRAVRDAESHRSWI